MNNEEHRVRQALAEWRLEPEADPGFRARVWQRIDRAVSSETWPVYVRRNAASVALALGLALVAGGWFGRVYAQQQVKHDRERLAWDYLASIDARYQADQLMKL